MPIPVHHDEPKPKSEPSKNSWPVVVFLLGAMIIIGAFCIGWRVTS